MMTGTQRMLLVRADRAWDRLGMYLDQANATGRERDWWAVEAAEDQAHASERDKRARVKLSVRLKWAKKRKERNDSEGLG